ncbi:MAG: methylmalonyl Co-A mutase-associated GTPase MeaB [Chloroflexi bacterium]|nr:methylmalonyl Co-A mutase-associated GTPase MeaB [Chloroflexota bacterium]
MKAKLASKVLSGDTIAAAKLISGIADEVPGAFEEMSHIYPHTGKAYIVGITGAPGAGKSTLTSNLISHFRKENRTVGVIAIDPTSAFTGGALLGDRVRMQQHGEDKDVFIRSLATRGLQGGLAKATIGTIHIMDAMGKDIILVETVGSGQIEIDITRVADTTLFVMTPGAGDAIQMMKAGILEATDIFVINKADKGGADVIKADLQSMLSMKSWLPGEWQPSITLTEALYNKGTAELAAEIAKHRQYLRSTGELEKRKKQRLKLELMESVERLVKDRVSSIDRGEYLDTLIDDLLKGKTDPQTASLHLVSRLVTELGPVRKQRQYGGRSRNQDKHNQSAVT